MEKICLNCGNKFEAKRSTAKFCKPACRVSYSRNEDLKSSELAVTQSAISPPCGDKNDSVSEKPEKKPDWVIKIEQYCNNQNITPDDLIEFHSNHRMVKKDDTKTASHHVEDESITRLSPFFERLRKTKLGLQ